MTDKEKLNDAALNAAGGAFEKARESLLAEIPDEIQGKLNKAFDDRQVCKILADNGINAEALEKKVEDFGIPVKKLSLSEDLLDKIVGGSAVSRDYTETAVRQQWNGEVTAGERTAAVLPSTSAIPTSPSMSPVRDAVPIPSIWLSRTSIQTVIPCTDAVHADYMQGDSMYLSSRSGKRKKADPYSKTIIKKTAAGISAAVFHNRLLTDVFKHSVL